MNYSNPTYVSNVQKIVQYLGNYVRSTTDIENKFPEITNVPAYMASGIRLGWACRTQIQPDLWRANVDMMYVNTANQVLTPYVGSFVRIPPKITFDQRGPLQEPYNNNPRNFCYMPLQ